MSAAFIVVGVILVVITLIGLAVLAVWRRTEVQMGLGTFIAAYFYLVSMVSLLAMVSGGAMLTKAVASDWFGRNFSYYDYSADYSTEPQVKVIDLSDQERLEQVAQEKRLKQQQIEQVEGIYQDDVFNGVSALVVGALFLIVHIIGWRRIESAQVRQTSLLYKGYVLLQLVMYSLITLVALPLAISNTLRFVMASGGSNMPLPGESVGIALWATPVWLIWVWVTMRVWKKSNSA